MNVQLQFHSIDVRAESVSIEEIRNRTSGALDSLGELATIRDPLGICNGGNAKFPTEYLALRVNAVQRIFQSFMPREQRVFIVGRA